MCCQILAPFALIYGFKALKEYKTYDPGDKSSVIIGMVCGGVGVFFILARIALAVAMSGAR